MEKEVTSESAMRALGQAIGKQLRGGEVIELSSKSKPISDAEHFHGELWRLEDTHIFVARFRAVCAKVSVFIRVCRVWF